MYLTSLNQSLSSEYMITTSSYEKRFIAEKARSIRAKRILEIGVFKGETTAVLSRVADENDGYVVAVDPMKWASQPASFGEYFDALFHPRSYEGAFRKNISRGSSSRVKLYKNLSTDAVLLDDPSDELREFDLVFIDGDHTYEGALRDLRNWGSRGRQGGLILMHDVRPRFPGVMKTFDEHSKLSELRAHWPERGSVGVFEVLGSPKVLTRDC